MCESPQVESLQPDHRTHAAWVSSQKPLAYECVCVGGVGTNLSAHLDTFLLFIKDHVLNLA